MTGRRFLPAAAMGAALVATALTLPPGSARADDWPGYRGPEGSGVSSEHGLLTLWPEGGPKELWRIGLGQGFSGIAAVGDRLYTMYGSGGDEFLVALEAATGAEAWKLRTDDNRQDDQGAGPRATPAVDGDRLYALSARGRLLAVSVEDGGLLWQRDLVGELGARVPRWGMSASPVPERGLVLLAVGAGDGRAIMAFRRLDGAVAWSAHTDSAGYSTPIVATIHGTRQAIFFTGSSLVSVAPGDGRLLWSRPWRTSYDVNAAMPVLIRPDRIFISSSYDTGAAALRVTGGGEQVGVEELWRSRVMKNHFSSSVLHDGYLYGFDDATLKCIDPASGDEQWRQRGFAKGSLLVADGHLLILGERGQLAVAAATPAAYRETGRAQPFTSRTWTMPTLSQGRLYLRDEAEMVALDLRGR